MVRCVTTDYKIIELTAKPSLFKKKLNSIQLSNHIVKTITETLQLQLIDWTSVQLDRASTNKAALCLITENYKEANPVK